MVVTSTTVSHDCRTASDHLLYSHGVRATCTRAAAGFYADDDPNPNWRCTQAMAKPGLSILFFVSFTVIASLVILSMFIGTISLSMGESIQQLNKEILMKKQRTRARQVAKKMERMKSSTRIKTAEQVRLEEATTGVASAAGDLKKKSEVGVTHFAALRAAMFP